LKPDEIDQAARIIAAAHRGGVRPECLPAECAPQDASDALLIQAAVTDKLQEKVAGWKVGGFKDGVVTYGAIHASRLFQSPARMISAEFSLRGVEAEIAFRFDRELASRSRSYDYDEIAESVTALVAIEVVDSRFQSYERAPFLDRVADLMSNGALVMGTERQDWRQHDLGRLTVSLAVGGEEILRQVGGHPKGDPLLPVVDLVNHLTKSNPVRAGAVMTTGSFSGLSIVEPGSAVKVEFVDFGQAEIAFTR
jgi:2-keto-4-pentenoate hydratase